MTFFSSPPPFSCSLCFSVRSPRVPRYFSHCLHLPLCLITLFSLPSRCVSHPPLLVPPALLPPFFLCLLASFPTCLSFHPTHLLLCLITVPLPFPFIHSLVLHTVMLCLSACMPVGISHKGLSEASALLIHSLCIASHICRVRQMGRERRRFGVGERKGDQEKRTWGKKMQYYLQETESEHYILYCYTLACRDLLLRSLSFRSLM